MPFSSLPGAIAAALADRGYEAPTSVQAEVVAAPADRDLIVSARTGSGKTVAYGLAIAHDLIGEADRMPRAGAPLALVIAPTRELALQVQRELAWLYAKAGARIASCVGGMDIRREQRALAQGAHIVVGTPGRLRDHLERGSLATEAMRAVILDEADEMLDLGFRDELEEILDMLPPERRTLMFSATMPKPIAAMAKRYQKDALRITTAGENQPHGDIDYRAIPVAPADIENAVVNILRYYEVEGAMVFCATRENVRHLHASLQERGFAAVALSGELSQSERNRALQALRDRRARVCIATDVAARGIDLPNLGLVIHAELPNDPETLQHRSGRTGRAGRKGTCVLIVPYPRKRRTQALLRAANVDARWMSPPSLDEIRERDRERMLEAIIPDDLGEEDRAAGRALLAAHSAEDIAAAFVRAHRADLPAPEELLDAGPDGPAPQPRGPRPGFEGAAWFRMDVGRAQNADPRWLLPLLCRRGHITKGDIGAIRIFDRETRFEVAGAAAGRFAAALKRTAGDSDDVRIEPANDIPPPAGDERRSGAPKRYQPKRYKPRRA